MLRRAIETVLERVVRWARQGIKPGQLVQLRQRRMLMPAVSSKLRLHATKIDINEATRAKLIEVLNQTLAATLDLKTQIKYAHWNVKGMNFFQLHEMFDKLAEEFEVHVDLFAERVTSLGGTAMGTARIAASQSILAEYPYDAIKGEEHVKALIDRFAIFAKHLRTTIAKIAPWDDVDTVDLYTNVSRSVDLRLWFLEAHMQVG
jgi:starvation-inducible DNA-binding protein